MDRGKTIREKLNSMHQAPGGMQGDVDAIWEKLELKLEKPESKRRGVIAWKIAAMFVLIVGIGLLMWWLPSSKQAASTVTSFKESVPLNEASNHMEAEPAATKNFISVPLPQGEEKKINDNRRRIDKEVALVSSPLSDTIVTTSVTIVPDINREPVTVNNLQPQKPRFRIMHINELQNRKELQQKEEQLRVSRKEAFIQLPAFFPKLGKKVETDSLSNN